MAAPAPLMRSLYSKLDISRGPQTPSGVYARVVEGSTLYVNTTEIEKAIAIQGKKHGVFGGCKPFIFNALLVIAEDKYDFERSTHGVHSGCKV